MKQDDEYDCDGAQTLDVGSECSIAWCSACFVARKLQALDRCLAADQHLRRLEPAWNRPVNVAMISNCRRRAINLKVDARSEP
jgi:hypothetical protein